MKKAEIVSLARERAYRYANQDNAKSKPYAEAYLSAAVNYAITKQYYIDLQQGEDKDFNGLFLGTWENWPVKWSESRKLHYIELPARMIPLPKDRGLPYVGPMQNEGIQYPIVGQSTISMIGGYFKYDSRSFGMIEGQKVYLHNHNDVVDCVLVKMVTDVADLDDDDFVPIPSGLEKEVIDMVAEFLVGRKSIPEDNTIDNVEK